MRQRVRSLAVLAVLAMPAAEAAAQYSVVTVPDRIRVRSQNAGGDWRFTVEPDDLPSPKRPRRGELWQVFFMAHTNESISSISVPTGEGEVQVYVVRASPQPYQWPTRVSGIVERSGNGILHVAGIDARDWIGPLTADKIGELRAGIIQGPIVSRSGIGLIDTMTGGTAIGPIVAESGGIRAIRFGRLLADGDPGSADVSALNGSIEEITGGDIGTPDAPVVIRFKGGGGPPGAADARLSQFAAGTVFADIAGTGADAPGRLAELYRFTTTGSFTGALAMGFHSPASNSLPSPLFSIGGDLDADVSFLGGAHGRIYIGGEFRAGRTFRIGTALGCAGPAEPLDPRATECTNNTSGGCNGFDARFTIGAPGGLKGHVIVGSRIPAGGLPDPESPGAPPFTAGEWHETLLVGDGSPSPVTIGGGRCYNNAEYAASADDLGGGSVGVVPFRIHPTDTDPPRGTLFNGLAALQFNLRFYGPVYWDEAVPDARPIRLESRPIGSQGWSDADPCRELRYSLGGDGRTVTIQCEGVLVRGYEYRFAPRTAPPGQSTLYADALRCAIEADDDPPVAEADDQPWFTVLGTACGTFDLDASGVIGLDDLSIMIAEWGATGCHLAADANRDGVVNVADMALLIERWGQTCR